MRAFVAVIESLRFETQGLPLKEMVAAMLDRSGLIRHYETEKEGRERIENLQELVNAAAAFLAEERFAPEAPANLGLICMDLRPGARTVKQTCSGSSTAIPRNQSICWADVQRAII